MSAAHDRTAAMAIDASAAPAPPTDWQLALASKWQALGRELLGLHPGPRRRLAELGRELQCLAVAVALFETRGNLTLAAQHLGTHRRMVRERLADWRRLNFGARLLYSFVMIGVFVIGSAGAFQNRMPRARMARKMRTFLVRGEIGMCVSSTCMCSLPAVPGMFWSLVRRP